MKQLNISFANRTEKGRHASCRLRKSGRIPAVVYGKSGNFPISIADRDFRMLMREKGSSAAIIELKSEDREVLAILQEIQRDNIRDGFLHVDFLEVAKDEKFAITVPVRVVGECIGVKTEKGMLEVVRRSVTIRCFPKDLVGFVEIDVSDLHANNNIHVKDLPALPGIEYVGDPLSVVVSCVTEDEGEEDSSESATDSATEPAAK